MLQHLVGALNLLTPGRATAERERRTRLREKGRSLLAVDILGGVGDMIVIARFMRDLGAEAGPFGFDVFCAQPERAAWVFGAVPGFGAAHYDTARGDAGAYDVRLEISQLVVVAAGSLRRDRFAGNWRLLEALEAIERSARQLATYTKHQAELANGIGRKAVYANRSRRDFLHYLAGVPYSGDHLDIAVEESALGRFALSGRRWITIHNGFDPNFVVSAKRATKCYPHFSEIVMRVKTAQPDIIVVQIGSSTSEKLPSVDLDLVDRTNLREAAALLRDATLHIDNEGGLVHLAACFGTRSVVVFGPTPSDYFGYPHNINVDPVRCGGCWWIDELWMDRCPRGMVQPECVFTQPPETIAALVLEALGPASSGDVMAVKAAPQTEKGESHLSSLLADAASLGQNVS